MTPRPPAPPFALGFVAEVPDRPALAALLLDYYAGIVARLAAAGGPTLDPATLRDGVWTDIESYLPPTGRLALAHDPSGRLIGCGFMRRIRPDTGELKRLYVRPEARGAGLGRRLVEARMAAAREMGWRRLLVDTIRGNAEMLALYRSLGFRPTERYPENANDPALAPYLVYLARDLD